MAEHVQLGRLLVERGLLAPDLLEVALAEQQQSRRTLGQVLVEMGAVREDDLIAVLAQQVGFEFVELTPSMVVVEAAHAIPTELSRRRQVIAVEWRGEALVVAMADPSDGATIDELRKASGHDVVAVVATRTAIDSALAALEAGALGLLEAPAAIDDATPRRSSGSLLLEEARAARATEVLVEPAAVGGRVRLRIDGVLQEAARLSRDALIGVRGSLAELVASTAGIELVTLPTVHGDTVVVRLVGQPGPPRTLDELDLGDDAVAQLRALLAGGHGAVVVTGPSGAGVTTTLHALLGEAGGPGLHLVAVEDPIERELDGVTQVVAQPDLPVATTVRRAIESRPDVLLLGEVRDGATAATALDAALSGRLVLAGLTGRDAAAVPGRFLAMGLEPVLVASALRGVVAQRLVRRLCESCKVPWTPSDAELDAAGWDDALDEVPTLYRAAGCEACQDIGYRGVAAIAEVLEMTDDLARLLALRANHSDLHKLAVAQGMRGLRQSGLALVRAGTTSLAEVARVS